MRRQLGQNFRFVELANDVNDHMPDYVVQRVTRILNNASKAVRGSTVLLVGLAYKKNTGDIRESPALRVISPLQELGATVKGVDSLIEDHRRPAGVEMVSLDENEISSVDIAVLLTDHDDIDLSLLESAPCPVFDTRSVLSGDLVERL